jgi:hypothetical protein
MAGRVAKIGNRVWASTPRISAEIKNREYSQAIGRHDFFDRRKA